MAALGAEIEAQQKGLDEAHAMNHHWMLLTP